MRKNDLYTNIHHHLYGQVGMGRLITVRGIRSSKAHGTVQFKICVPILIFLMVHLDLCSLWLYMRNNL